MTLTIALVCAAALLALAAVGVIMGRSPRRHAGRLRGESHHCGGVVHRRAGASPRRGGAFRSHAAARRAVARRAFPPRRAVRLLSHRGRSRRHERQPVRARLWRARNRTAARAAVLRRLPRRHDAGRARRRRLHVPVLLGVHVAHLLGAGDVAPPRRGKRARRLRLSGDGELRHAHAAVRLRPPGRPGRPLHFRADARRASFGGARRAGARPGADRRRLQGRHRPAACVAAARPSGGAEPRLRADERRDDQGRRLRLRAHRLRARRPPGLVVEHRRPRRRRT